MGEKNTVIMACSSLAEYVEEAQKIVGTDFPIIYLDRLYHRDPKEMQTHILEELERLPEGTDTVLVSMGFCGGSWQRVVPPCKLVIPKIDDCVSLLLQTGDLPISDLKTPGHLYVRDMDPKKESFKAIFEGMTKDVDDKTKERYHKDWQSYYSNIDIMDTGINNSRSDEYYNEVKKDAQWLDAKVGYVPAGTHLLEKLFRGEWDEQFLIVEPGKPIKKKDVLMNVD